MSERVITLLNDRHQKQKRSAEGWVYPLERVVLRQHRTKRDRAPVQEDYSEIRDSERPQLYCARHTFGTVTTAEMRNPGLVKEVIAHQSLNTTMGLRSSRDVSDQVGHRPSLPAEVRDVATAAKMATGTGRGWVAVGRESLKTVW